ncbi:MAG: cytochrome c biogenesis protein CcsA [Actinomycetota bacterium]|nr:cytochrome c biogenesis protein CcsA [Actinomycetota bacterium]
MALRMRLFYALAALSAVLTVAGLVGAFYITPLEVKQIGFTQKIFYFHVPMASTSGVAFGVTLVASIAYLITRDLKWDTWAYVGAELGLIFGSALMTMGIIWTRSTWGVWWTWDPRLTSYLVVMLLYGAYFVLRSSVEGAAERARYSASIGILGYITVVFTMISTRILRTAHPVVFSLKDPGVTPDMFYTFMVAMWSAFALFGAFLLAKVTIENLTEEIANLKDEIGG